VEFRAVAAYLQNATEEVHRRGTVYERGALSFSGRPCGVAVGAIGAGNPRAGFEAARGINHIDAPVALFVGGGGGMKQERVGGGQGRWTKWGRRRPKEGLRERVWKRRKEIKRGGKRLVLFPKNKRTAPKKKFPGGKG